MKDTLIYALLTLSLLALVNLPLQAQLPCGTIDDGFPNIPYDNYKLPENLTWKNGDDAQNEFVIKLNINVFGINPDIDTILEDAITDANKHFAPIGIHFETCGDPIVHDSITVIDSTVRADLRSMDKLGFINVYVASYVQDSGNDYVCGLAYLPNSFHPTGGKCRILMNWNCFAWKTFIHELGHLFGLRHTHGSSNEPESTNEWVNGCNCKIAGDWICDTPADPYLIGKVSNNCEYTGDVKDEFGDAYQPSVKNIMSYAAGHCTNEFTPEQYERMLYNFHFHWKKTLTQEPTNLIINKIPEFTYVGAPDIPLNDAYAISGSGIINNYFSPEKAGVGNHELLFSKNYNTFLDNYINPTYREKITPNETLWQSFSPNYSGALKSIKLPIYPISEEPKNVEFNIDLYEGIGIEGPKIFESTVQIPSYLLFDFKENFSEYSSCLTEISIPSIDVNKENQYTVQIQSEQIDSIFYVGTYLESIFSHSDIDYAELGYESNLTTTYYTEAETLYTIAETLYNPILIPADTFIYHSDLTGLDSSCFALLTDTIIKPAYILNPDTIYSEADTIYIEADTLVTENNIGLSTIVRLANEDTCQSQFTKTIKVLPSPTSIYPNPAIEYITIDYAQNEQLQPTSVEIYSINGEQYHQEVLPSFMSDGYVLNQTQLKVDIGNLPPGLYVISIIYEEGIFAKRFVKL